MAVYRIPVRTMNGTMLLYRYLLRTEQVYALGTRDYQRLAILPDDRPTYIGQSCHHYPQPVQGCIRPHLQLICRLADKHKKLVRQQRKVHECGCCRLAMDGVVPTAAVPI